MISSVAVRVYRDALSGVVNGVPHENVQCVGGSSTLYGLILSVKRHIPPVP